MKILLCFFIFIASVDATCQQVIFNADSSNLIFPNNVQVPIEKQNHNGRTTFIFSDKAVKTWIAQSNYLLASKVQDDEGRNLFVQEIALSDSTKTLMNAQLSAERSRAEVYRTNFIQLKEISDQYDRQVRSLINELEATHRNQQRVKRRQIIKGLLAGFVGGVVIGGLAL